MCHLALRPLPVSGCIIASYSSGYEVADPSAFAKRVTALMADGEAGLAALQDTQASTNDSSGDNSIDDDFAEIEFPEDDEPVTPEVV